jgi:hypothetical protein
MFSTFQLYRWVTSKGKRWKEEIFEEAMMMHTIDHQALKQPATAVG